MKIKIIKIKDDSIIKKNNNKIKMIKKYIINKKINKYKYNKL